LAEKYGNSEFAIPISRLSDIEAKGVIPSIYRLYALSIIYRKDLAELHTLFGVDVNQSAADMKVAEVPKTHKIENLFRMNVVNVPVTMEAGFDLKRTANLGRMIRKWGILPVSFLEQFAEKNYTYAYIGSEDFTMFPILLPGSLVQVDERECKIQMQQWRTEYERPIFFVETRDGYVCCWCAQHDAQNIVLQPHPLSPATPRIMKCPQEAEIIGRVTALAMRLDEWSVPDPLPTGKAPQVLN
jgi:hypothetical protein